MHSSRQLSHRILRHEICFHKWISKKSASNFSCTAFTLPICMLRMAYWSWLLIDRMLLGCAFVFACGINDFVRVSTEKQFSDDSNGIMLIGHPPRSTWSCLVTPFMSISMRNIPSFIKDRQRSKIFCGHINNIWHSYVYCNYAYW